MIHLLWGTWNSQIHRDRQHNSGYQALEEEEQILFTGYRLSLWNDGRVLELGSGGSCMPMQLDLMSLHGTVKNSQNDQFYATYILSQFKKKH